MKTKYEFLDNVILVSVISDAGNILHARCTIFTEGFGSMKIMKSIDCLNVNLTPAKFWVFCRSMTSRRLEEFYQFQDAPFEPSLDLDFELR